MVRGDRRDAAEIVDAGSDQLIERMWIQIGRCLYADIFGQQQARDRNAPQMLVQIGLGRIRHCSIGLGAKVLHDDLLQMTVAFVQVAQCEQCLDALTPGFADTDQDPAGKRHGLLAGRVHARQTCGWQLVRASVVRAAFFAQARRSRFEHQAHRHADLAQRGDLRGAHQARIQVRQQTGFLVYPLRNLAEVADRARVPEFRQRLTCRAIAQLRLVAEREQGLVTARFGAGVSDCYGLFDGQICGFGLARRVRKGAVPAHIPAQMGERNKDLR